MQAQFCGEGRDFQELCALPLARLLGLQEERPGMGLAMNLLQLRDGDLGVDLSGG